MGKIAVVFGVKAVTYAIKHGLGVGHLLKNRSYQVSVKNIHHWMSYSTQSDKFGVPVPKQDQSHPSPKAGQMQDFSQGWVPTTQVP